MREPGDRLDYYDLMRGLAVLVMLQGHAFEGWLRLEYRGSELFRISQTLGGLPAPIFLFLAGGSQTILLDRMRQRGAGAADMIRRVVRRSAWLLLLAYAFRIEQYLIWRPESHWQDLFRIDTLNCIAASSLFAGLFSIAWPGRRRNMIANGLIATLIVFGTPLIFGATARVPNVVLDYLHGNGHPEYFGIFPWMAFSFAGAAISSGVLEARNRGGEKRFLGIVALGGVLTYVFGTAMRLFPIFEYGHFDYSLTSPHFFLIRFGCLLVCFYGAYRISEIMPVQSTPIRTLGRASLLIYWIHIEIVYGRPLGYFSHSLQPTEVLLQLFWLVPAMLGLAVMKAVRDQRKKGKLRAISTRNETLRNSPWPLRRPSFLVFERKPNLATRMTTSE